DAGHVAVALTDQNDCRSLRQRFTLKQLDHVAQVATSLWATDSIVVAMPKIVRFRGKEDFPHLLNVFTRRETDKHRIGVKIALREGSANLQCFAGIITRDLVGLVDLSENGQPGFPEGSVAEF